MRKRLMAQAVFFASFIVQVPGPCSYKNFENYMNFSFLALPI